MDFGFGVEFGWDGEDSLLDGFELVLEDTGGQFGYFSVV
jgi:hypothetical protein